MNIYEDEEPEGGITVLDFLKQNKQLALSIVAAVAFYAFANFTTRQLEEEASSHQTHSEMGKKSNPWAKDR